MQILPNLFWWLYERGGSNCPQSGVNSSGASESPITGNAAKETNSSIPKTKEELTISQYISKDGLRTFSEVFPSIEEMVRVLHNRPNSELFKDEHSSQRSSTDPEDADGDVFEWTGTNTYEEAEQLIEDGYTDILPEISQQVKSIVSNYKQELAPKSNIHNAVVGYIPNVPNALRNLPESMILRETQRKPHKTVFIRFFEEANFDVSKETIKNCGIKLLAAIQILENQGINVKVSASMIATSNDTWLRRRTNAEPQIVDGSVILKDYTDRLNIQKMCFPLAHASFLRRFGFKFLETFPTEISSIYTSGYGTSVNASDLEEVFNVPGSVVITTNLLNNYSIPALIKYISSRCQIS